MRLVTILGSNADARQKHKRTPRRRTSLQLWTLLHAQALLDGRTRGTDDVAFIEDDCRRLAARHQT